MLALSSNVYAYLLFSIMMHNLPIPTLWFKTIKSPLLSGPTYLVEYNIVMISSWVWSINFGLAHIGTSKTFLFLCTSNSTIVLIVSLAWTHVVRERSLCRGKTRIGKGSTVCKLHRSHVATWNHDQEGSLQTTRKTELLIDPSSAGINLPVLQIGFLYPYCIATPLPSVPNRILAQLNKITAQSPKSTL